MRIYERLTAGLGPRSSFHYREPTTMNSRSSKHRVLNAQYTRYRPAEIRLPKGPSILVELTGFVLDEKYIQGGT